MLATIVHRGLTVWIDPVALSARIQVHMPGRPDSHIVLVQPRDGGWAVEDDREDEPIWFGRFEAALAEAISCGAQALEDRLLGEARAAGRAAAWSAAETDHEAESDSATPRESPWALGPP